LNRLYLFLLWIVTTLIPINGSANTYVANHVGYHKGAPEDISPQAVSQLAFTPINDRFSLGYNDSPVWMRVDVKRGNNLEALNFSLWPPRFQNISVYLQTDQGFTKLISADEYKISNDYLFGLFHNNIYKLGASDKDQVLFFKLHSKSSIIGNIDVYPNQAINDESANQGFLLGSIFFGLAPFILVFLLLAVYTRLPIYFFYSINLITTAILFLGSAGFDFQDFIPYFLISLEDQVAFLTMVNPLFAYLFMTYVADLLHTPHRITSRLRFYLYALILLSPIYFLIDTAYLSKMYMINNILLSGTMIFLIVKYFDRKNKIEWPIAIVFVLMNLMAPRVFVALLGYIEINTSIFMAQSIRIVMVPIVLMLVLALFESKNRNVVLDLEIKRKVAEENRLIEDERRRTYERFITMIVHEIKTPLSIIQIAAASLHRHLVNNTPELKRINHIQESVTEINQVFNRCMQVVDVENGTVAVQPSAFGLPVLLDDLKRSLKSERIRFELETNQKINTDYVILKTILVNLLSNAIKYAKANTAIVLSIQDRVSANGSPNMRFCVCNSIGPIGAPDAQLTFTRYYRAESAKVHGGTGLGLWLSQELASSIGARIQLRCTDAETCFELTVDMT